MTDKERIQRYGKWVWSCVETYADMLNMTVEELELRTDFNPEAMVVMVREAWDKGQAVLRGGKLKMPPRIQYEAEVQRQSSDLKTAQQKIDRIQERLKDLQCQEFELEFAFENETTGSINGWEINKSIGNYTITVRCHIDDYLRVENVIDEVLVDF